MSREGGVNRTGGVNRKPTEKWHLPYCSTWGPPYLCKYDKTLSFAYWRSTRTNVFSTKIFKICPILKSCCSLTRQYFAHKKLHFYLVFLKCYKVVLRVLYVWWYLNLIFLESTLYEKTPGGVNRTFFVWGKSDLQFSVFLNIWQHTSFNSIFSSD